MSEEKKECCPEGKCCPECCEECCTPWWRYIFHLFGRRTIMAYAFTGAAVFGFLKGLIEPAPFVGMVELVLAYYFLTRKSEQV